MQSAQAELSGFIGPSLAMCLFPTLDHSLSSQLTRFGGYC